MSTDLFVIWQGVFYYDQAGQFRVTEGNQSVDVSATLDQYVGQKVHLFLMHQPKFLSSGKADKASILAASQSWGMGSCFWGPMGTCPFGHHEPGKAHTLYNQQVTGLLEKKDGVYSIGGEVVHLDYADGHNTVFALFLHEDELQISANNLGEVLSMQDNLVHFLQVLSNLKESTEHAGH